MIDTSVLHSWICLLLVSIVILVEQDVELGQLRHALGQLREEKEKETGQANKLDKELDGEYSLIGLSDEATFLFDRISQCLQTTIGGSRRNSTCWSRTPERRETDLML